jgi:carbamoyltransferase
MIILGVSFDYHDAAAALVRDGEVVCAIQEERLTRIKHDPVMPVRAIEACLKSSGVTAGELDAVVHYEDPMVKFDRICRAAVLQFPPSISTLNRALRSWTDAGKFEPCQRLSALLGIDRSRVVFSEHHLSHAASAFYCSPFDEATIVTLDGVGEYETAAIFAADRTGIRKLVHTTYPDSIGLLYSAFTAYLGFEVNEGEYKVMGLAAFGRPTYYELIRQLVRVTEKGEIKVDQSYFNFKNPANNPFTQKLVNLLGAARHPDAPFNPTLVGSVIPEDSDSSRFANIAASVQKVTEEVILDFVERATRFTGLPNLCMAGGVALNSLANGKLQVAHDEKIYIHPAAGDAGGAVGAALLHYHRLSPAPIKRSLRTPYLGLSYSKEEVLRAVRKYDALEVQSFDTTEQMVAAAADYLAAGKVLGWMQGRFEWGPRALGARSIIASPVFPDMKDRVNQKIKFRELFRPFAPSVLADVADKYFELPQRDYDSRLEDFMLSVCPVREEYRSRLPAIVHVDGTARVQTVREDLNPEYYALIRRVGEITGIPVVLNTSFNLRGEPIVSSPEDAMQTFEWSNMDYLVMGNVIVSRPDPSRLLQNIIAKCGCER